MPLEEPVVNAHVLTRRERLILLLAAEGYRNKEIADELCISEESVKKHQDSLKRKLNAPNKSSLTRSALAKGLITLYEVLES